MSFGAPLSQTSGINAAFASHIHYVHTYIMLRRLSSEFELSILAIRLKYFFALAASRDGVGRRQHLKFDREKMNSAANILCQPYCESPSVAFRV